MEASKVSLNPELLENNLLTPKRKSELRKNLIFEKIRKTPAGKGLTVQELIEAGRFDKYTTGFQFIQAMVKRGELGKEKTKTFRKIWTIPADVRTTVIAGTRQPVSELPSPGTVPIIDDDAEEPTPEEIAAVAATEEDGRHKGPRASHSGHETSYSLGSLEAKGAIYSWYYPDGDVKGFINWLRSQDA